MMLSLAEKILIIYAIVQALLLGFIIGFIVGRYGCGNGIRIKKENDDEYIRRLIDDHR